MKFILIAIFNLSLLISKGAFAQIPLQLSEYTVPAIQAIFTQRCIKYANFSQSLYCYSFINNKDGFFDSLELKIKKNKTHKEYIVFESELTEILKKTKTLNYLRQLQDQLDRLGDFDDDIFSLWEFTLYYFNNDFNNALKHIAVLFQDTHELLHIARLSRLNLIKNSTLELLSEVNHELSQESLNQNPYYKNGRLKLFPISLDRSNPSLYHFYTPAYLNYKLSNNFPKLKKLSKGLSFYLTLFYKTAHYYMGKWIMLTDLPWITVDTAEDEFRIRDLYMSYKAVNWVHHRACKSYQQFEYSIEHSIPGTIYNVFNY